MLCSQLICKVYHVMNYTTIPSLEILEKTARALKKNNFEPYIVENREEARKKTLSLIPKGSEVMNMTSVTLDETGILKALEDGNYDLVKDKLTKMSRKTQNREMQRLGAAPEYSIGSVHAVTQDGHVLIASNSGSQLPGYVYGSDKVIWVVGAQKIVKNIDEGIKRIYEHSYPLEDKRAQIAYGTGSFVSKILIYNREKKENRNKVILVREILGF